MTKWVISNPGTANTRVITPGNLLALIEVFKMY